MAFLPVSCKNGTKFVRNSYEVRTKFVRNLYEFRTKSASQIGTVNVVVTKFARSSYEIRTNFVRISHEVQTICMNLCHFCVCVGVPGQRGCCLCGRGCMVCACVGDMCMHWWFLGSWVVLLNHVGQYFCAVCSL